MRAQVPAFIEKIAVSMATPRQADQLFLTILSLAPFHAWRNSGLLATINQLLATTARQKMGREASPSASVIDSQPVKSREAG